MYCQEKEAHFFCLKSFESSLAASECKRVWKKIVMFLPLLDYKPNYYLVEEIVGFAKTVRIVYDNKIEIRKQENE